MVQVCWLAAFSSSGSLILKGYGNHNPQEAFMNREQRGILTASCWSAFSKVGNSVGASTAAEAAVAIQSKLQINSNAAASESIFCFDTRL